MICYDVEFPELSRLMADQGMNILFVPFLTDTQNGYTRVSIVRKRELLKTNVMWLLPVVLVTYKSKQYGYSVCTSCCFTPLILHSK
jgi:predicted amidohydrolase